MNVESSRSHLIVGIMVESRNLTNGSVNTGKLSLVDLAGSERAAKTGAKDHQLKVCSCVTMKSIQTPWIFFGEFVVVQNSSFSDDALWDTQGLGY